MSISLSGISKKFKNVTVLENINLTVNDGEYVELAGANGTGKSTLLSILAGIRKANSGFFEINGEDSKTFLKKNKNYIALVPQRDAFFEELTVYDNLRLWHKKKVILEELEEGKILAELSLDTLLNRKIKTLSYGMQKRVSIAAALLYKPHILLLDEVSNDLDVETKNKIKQMISILCKEGNIVIAATHEDESKEGENVLSFTVKKTI